MAQMSDFLENVLINHVLRNTAFTSPVTVYVALYSTDPTDADTGTEITGGGYARQAVAFAAPAGGSTSNSAQVSFPEATAAYPAAVTHIGLRDAATLGTLLFYTPFAAAKTIGVGDTFIIKAGQLTVSLA
jgi:hypothetical protein